MESTDRQILTLLASEGRMSYTDIGKATGLSTSAAQQRVRRLEQRGVITGYRAVLNPEALDRGLVAFIEVHPLDATDESKAKATIEEMPEAVSAYSVAGQASFLVVVRTKSTADLDELLTRMRQRANCSTVTTMVLTTLFEGRPLMGPEEE